MIDRNSPIPIYYQLMRYFKQLIETGHLHPGDRLPTEAELCALHKISRAPVRRALTDLARDGYVYRRPGQGTFVVPALPQRIIQQTEVHLMTHYDIRWLDSMEKAVYKWNQLHPQREVKLVATMCARDEFKQVLQRKVAQGKAPDVVPMDCVWISSYAAAGYITPLDRVDSQWVSELRKNLEPLVLEGNSSDGHLYGVPVQTDVTGLWYRRDWFEAEGLQPPQTWQEWLDLIDYFKRPSLKSHYGYDYSVAFPVSANVGEATINNLMSFFWSSGASLVNEDHSMVHLDDPAVYKALRFLLQITNDRRDFLPPDMHVFRWWNVTSLLAQGKTPMVLGGSYEWPRLQEESDWDDEATTCAHLGFVPAPRATLEASPVCSVGGTSWAILEQSPVCELVLEILKIVASQESSVDFCQENLQISPFTAVNRRLATPEHPWFETLVPLLRWGRLRPLLVNYNQVSRFLQEMVEQVLWHGAPLEDMVQRTEQLLALLLEDDHYRAG